MVSTSSYLFPISYPLSHRRPLVVSSPLVRRFRPLQGHTSSATNVVRVSSVSIRYVASAHLLLLPSVSFGKRTYVMSTIFAMGQGSFRITFGKFYAFRKSYDPLFLISKLV